MAVAQAHTAKQPNLIPTNFSNYYIYTILLLLYYVLLLQSVSTCTECMQQLKQLLLTVAYVHAFSACGNSLEQKNII